jgi:hypothetical protein
MEPARYTLNLPILQANPPILSEHSTIVARVLLFSPAPFTLQIWRTTMRLSKHLAALPFLLALAAGGCSPQGDADSTEGVLDREELLTFHEEVTRALDDIHSELSAMQEQIAPMAEDSWTSLTATTERATDEMLADLDRLASATAEEARAIQRAAAERLAELEAEMTRSEISSALTADSLVATASNQLIALESDIHSIAEGMVTETGDVPVVGGIQAAEDDPMVLRERLAEIRADLNEVANEEAEEAFVASREELGSDIAQLTHEVRRKWYEQQWGLDS